MIINLNGEQTAVVVSRLDKALVELGYAETVVATAINGVFVPRSDRSSTELRDGDRLEVLAPLQGG